MQNDTEYKKKLIKAREGFSIILCLDCVIDIPESKEIIHRILRKKISEIVDVNYKQGSNALWELEMFRRFKLGNVSVVIDEPDLTISNDDVLNKYGVACKQIIGNPKEAFKKAIEQIKKVRIMVLLLLI